MTCLLCRQDLEQSTTFWAILCLYQDRQLICQSCREQFVRIGASHCPTCYKELTNGSCADCLYWQERGVNINHFALYRYNEAMKSYFSLYKFFGDYVLAQLFAKDVKEALKPYRDYQVVPVPVSPQTREERGFNQVEGLLEAAGVSYHNILAKGEGLKQSSKSRKERLESQPKYELLAGCNLFKKIILIDDIYTTGATIAVITRLLLENGVEEVKTFSLAR
ncbi:ComF family protein [Streptococcus entericus]|uniref:ComF family protein n=1 Tax=Streptococcus entericus TaxID=155680 RepID=UPI00036855D4|nr:ComF family protein [Streptococcus entericus]